MTLASSSETQLSYIEETTIGTTPTTGNSTNLRMTGESLNYDIQTVESAEINSTRQVTDASQISATAGGGVNLEVSYREYDPFLEALMASTFGTAFGTDGVETLTVTFDKTANTITDDDTDGFAGLVVGQYISIVDSVANNGVYRVQSMTDDVLTLDTDTPLLADGSADACDISSSRLSLGTAALRAFSLQKEFGDVTQFFVYRGMSPSKLDLSFDTGALLTGAFDFMGYDGARDGSTHMPGSPVVSEAHSVMNAVAGIGTILVDNDVIANTFVKSAKISADAKLRGQPGLGNLGNVGLGTGTFAIGGSLEVYLADGTLYDAALANTTVSVQIPVYDAAYNGYAFIFNNVKLKLPPVQAGGKDTDVMLTIPFSAIAPAPATDKMLVIDRFGVAGA